MRPRPAGLGQGLQQLEGPLDMYAFAKEAPVGEVEEFGLANDNEVFHADDRPYGLIEAAVLADDAPDPGPAWDPYPML